MSDEKNLSNLVKIVSSKTHQDPELVKHFLSSLFKEIERELVTTSHVKVDGLGIFRIINSIPSDKILFLDKFNELNKTVGDVSVEIAENTEDLKDTPEVFHTSSHAKTEIIDDQDSPDDEMQEEYDELRFENEKRRKSSKIGIIVLFTAIIVGVIALLVFFYPKEKTDTLYAPIERIQAYTALENSDTTLYISKIIADNELDFPSLSLDFYGSELFWPYIYKANEEEVNKLFEIKAGTIIRIPKLASELIDKNNKQSVDSIKKLQREIIDQRVNQQ